MKRRLFDILAAGSALLVIAAGAMWVRSYWASDVLTWRIVSRGTGAVARRYVVIESGRGGVGASCDAELYDPQTAVVRPGEQAWQYDAQFGLPPAYPRPFFRRGAGAPHAAFALRWQTDPATERRELVVPYPALLAPLLVPSAVWLWRRARRRRRADRARRGLCVRCGYDLRASPTRCPECGAPAGRAAVLASQVTAD